MKQIDKTQIAAGLLVVLIVAGAAAGYTGIFTTGSGVADEAPSGLFVTASVDHTDSDINPVRDNNSIYVADTYFNSSDDTAVTVDQFAGTTTQLSSIDATNGSIEINPGDKSAIIVDGSVTAISWEDAALDGSAQMTYSASGTGTITATGLPASTDYAAATTSGSVLTTGSTTAAGKATISVSSATDEQIVLLEPTAATASNLDPDTTDINNENVELSFDLSDQDFATDAGDSVDIDLVVDGVTVNSWTGVSSNQSLNYTAQNLADGNHDWHVETTDAYGKTSTSATATFSVYHYAPVIDNSSAQPADGTKLTEFDQTFTIDISDQDFVEPSGDTVSAELYVDGSSVGSDSLTANGTASVTTTISEGGLHEYYWIATDEYSNATQSQIISISVPDTLTIYSETEPDTKISATVNLTFYPQTNNPTIVSRNANDGTVNLTGLPADVPIIVTVNAEGYHDRRGYIPSLYKQQSVYMLNTSVSSVETIFAFTDYSGSYPPDDTVLYVERAVGQSWRPVMGDYFGAAGQFPATLEKDHRYQLTVINTKTGETTDVGTYTPTAAQTMEITVTDTEEVVRRFSKVIVRHTPSTGVLFARDNTTVAAQLSTTNATVESWTFNVSVDGTLVDSQTLSGTTDLASTSIDIANTTGKVVIQTNWTLENGATGGNTHEYRIHNFNDNDNALLSILGKDLPKLIPNNNWNVFSLMLSIVLTVFGTAAFSYYTRSSSEIAGGVAVIILAATSLLGWVGYQLVTIAAFVWMALTAIRRIP